MSDQTVPISAQAVLYLRSASRHQADRDQAIVAQQHLCQRRADELDAAVVGEFIDFGSGLSLARPGLANLLAKLAELRTGDLEQTIYAITADHARIGRSVQAYSHISYQIDRAGAILNIASIPLADYEALTSWPYPSSSTNGAE